MPAPVFSNPSNSPKSSGFGFLKSRGLSLSFLGALGTVIALSVVWQPESCHGFESVSPTTGNSDRPYPSTRPDKPVPTDASNCPAYSPRRQLRLNKELPATDPCINRGTSIVVLADSQLLFLCKNGQSVADFDFAMGSSGAGKTRAGDNKTPLGTYTLGQPRPSQDGFKTFIPIGYPTPEQVKKGYTGSAIGIHGPHRMFRCAGFLNVSYNWTQGCIAVADDLFIDQIADWVRRNRDAKLIHILETAPDLEQ